MLANMSSRLFLEWIAYDRVEPFGPWRDDIRAGVVASTIANVNRSKKTDAYTPNDFIPEFKMREVDTDVTMSDKIQMIARALGARKIRKKEKIDEPRNLVGTDRAE